MKHLLWVVGIVAMVPALYFFFKFYEASAGEGMQELAYSGVFFLVALICWAIFFFIRFREEGEQDISITKF